MSAKVYSINKSHMMIEGKEKECEEALQNIKETFGLLGDITVVSKKDHKNICADYCHWVVHIDIE